MSPSNSPQTSSLPATATWTLCIGIILIGTNLRAPITSLGPVLPDIQTTLHLGSVGAGILNSLPLFLFACLSLVAPKFGKAYGLEKLIGIALIAILIGTLVRSISFPGTIWAGTVLLSIGIAFNNVLLPGIVKRDFQNHAAGVTGLYAASMAGMAGIATGVSQPISHIPGADWHWSIGCWALLPLITLIFWLPQWKKSHSAQTKDSDTLCKTVSPWKHRIGWQVSLFFATHSLVFYTLIDWYPSYAISQGLTLNESGTYLLVYQLVAIVANLIGGPIIRRSHHQSILGFSCGLLLLIGTLVLLLIPQLALLGLIFAGLGAGISMVTSLSLFGLRTHDHHQATVLSSMAQFIGYIGASCGPLVIGVLHQISGSWKIPMLLLPVIAIFTIIFATLSGRNRYISE